MNKNTTQTISGGVVFYGLLTIVFIVLKLTGYIAWSWWWVLSPIWIQLAIVAGVIILAFGGIIVLACIKTWQGK